MRKINFTKMVAAGNDFVVMESDYRLLAQRICDRKYGAGADGLLILQKSKIADIKMRIFNADGSEAEMCGNGARCVAFYLGKPAVKIETKAGIIEAKINGNNVKIKLTDPKNIKLDMPLKINNRKIKVNFINTGVPHSIIFVEGLEKVDAVNLGRQIREHKKFKPAGTNVDFVEILDAASIKIRTYERGVEDETLACGTGAVASVLVTVYRLPFTVYRKINVYTRSGEILKVYFDKINNKFKNIWLEGEVKLIYKGVYHV